MNEPQYYIKSNKYTLQERKTKKHGKVYDVVFRIFSQDGKEIQKKLSGYTSKSLAKEAYLAFVTEHCQMNKKFFTEIRTDKQVPTVGELTEKYIASLHNQNKDSSIYDKQNIYNMFVLPLYNDKKITVLTKEEIYRWQDDLWGKKNPRTNDYYSYKYLEKIRGHFSAFLQWSESRYGYPNNMKEVEKPKRRSGKTIMKIWTREEFEKFISVVDDEMYKCMFTLLFFTGRRKGEIFALTPEDVTENDILYKYSLTRKTIDGAPYKITTAKTDKIQRLPYCNTVKQALNNYTFQAPFLFGGENPISENTFTRVFQKYCVAADVPIIRIHDLRHSFVSMCIHMGANLTVIADLIGDTVEQVTKTYGHMYTSDRDKIIKEIN